MFWHAEFHNDPANQWLRSLVFDLHADASTGAGLSTVLLALGEVGKRGQVACAFLLSYAHLAPLLALGVSVR